MLSYQHAFHAGNHADILKHYVLCSVIQSLNKKEKPYTLYDTHAGSGLYDMLDNRSLKTNEAAKGIKKVENLGGQKAAKNLDMQDMIKAGEDQLDEIRLAELILEKSGQDVKKRKTKLTK